MAELGKHCMPPPTPVLHDQTRVLFGRIEFREMAVDSRHINDALDNAPGPEPSSSEEKGGGERTDDAGGSDEEKLSPKDVRCEVNELRLRSSTIDQLSRDETELRIKVYFHISNPLNRWRKYRYVTWKFFLQLVKTFCIAAQVCSAMGHDYVCMLPHAASSPTTPIHYAFFIYLYMHVHVHCRRAPDSFVCQFAGWSAIFVYLRNAHCLLQATHRKHLAGLNGNSAPQCDLQHVLDARYTWTIGTCRQQCMFSTYIHNNFSVLCYI